MIPVSIGKDLADAVINKVHGEDWGRNAYWFLQVRGQKDDNRHQQSTDSISEVLNKILRYVNTRRAYVFVDVGIEIHGPEGFSVLPRRHGHTQLLEKVLGIDPEDVNYKEKEVDPWSGVEEIAGARWNLHHPLTENEISYVQLYTSDKAPFYNASIPKKKMPEVGAIAALKMKDVDANLNFIQNLYANLLGGWKASMPVVTRLEARVPFRHAAQVFDDTKLVPTMYQGLVNIVANQYTWCVRGL
jgi:hypothetical protein